MNLPYAVECSWAVLISSGQPLLRPFFPCTVLPIVHSKRSNLGIARYFSHMITFTKQFHYLPRKCILYPRQVRLAAQILPGRLTICNCSSAQILSSHLGELLCAISYIFITLFWDAMSNNCLVSSETASLENDATAPSDASHDATSEEVTAYAAPEDIRAGNRGEYKFPNATWTLQSFDFTDRVDEPVREVPLALTQQTLQQHNAKNIPAVDKTMNKYPFDEHHMKPISLGDAAAHASTLDGRVCLKVHVEPYSYPRQRSKMDDQNFDADIGLLFPRVEHQGFHTYPTCINEVNLYDHLPEAEFYNDPSNTKPPFSESSAPEEVTFQVLNPWSNAYAGIGTQFSS